MLLWCIFYKKGFMKKYLCWFAYGEPYVPYMNIIKKIVGSTCGASNLYGVIIYKNNLYRSMIMDPIKMNKGYISECSIIYEEPNANTT